ncbi:carboxylate-amine ligase [Rhodococcus rhodochrous]|uniref:Putative glutamate--cysteine ligase 2 n=1 Tax=Rhodococcus rhodochrous TaxID=1829 RepID=A0AAW4XIT4_RHORH|nr:glutamate--cysteine ligase [Rhodococcus rhodochrous]MCD2112993.1 glutamate--cysteine ligase [Rhodococcus rhodochrous]QHG83519.1 YbdK family carboxylate-amine ligase [Rhodococcus rhodochrous]QOH56803.1 carboxylate--amine ligase [Rhodococcus rhodochrous]
MAATGPIDTSPVRGGVAATIGVEEEFVLVDPRTGRPLLRSLDVIEAGRALGIELEVELSPCQVETATAVCTHPQDLREQLRRSRATAADAAARAGCRLVAVGTPIFEPPSGSVTATPRYRRMAQHYGGVADGVICGCHVHIGVDDRDRAAQIINYLRPWLPTLLALTANSPIADGRDTGYASWRYLRWGRWPSAGLPPQCTSVADYDAAVESLLTTGTILDPRMVYWDVRISARHPTLEIRIADVPATVEETVTLATLVYALVAQATASIERGEAAPSVDQELLRAACWRAARDGLAGHGIDLGSAQLVPAVDLIRRLLAQVRPDLEELDAYRSVHDALAVTLDRGNGAIRQRRILESGGSFIEVVADATRRTVEN